ncbi:spherulation-specific family 4 protein [Nonomuraea sp. NBC_01738]|uniref:spherulation-specific family 4 protein n=1 Tax=Nonomuraea sp. NBC_01738 TaxID=2976003 RepID=UPI002E120157|nr:spherulation-specific family 4 protein [Nonomuraea sp. NBC_01738]
MIPRPLNHALRRPSEPSDLDDPPAGVKLVEVGEALVGACVPAFFHPVESAEHWRRLLAVPPRLAVVDPGPERDAAFGPVLARLAAAGTEVLARVDTDFGLRPAADVRADLRRVRAWYGVRGVFLDQVAAGADRLAHYREIVDGVRGTIVLNPGVYPDPGYAALADVLVTFDGPLAAYRAIREPAWARELARGRFCHLIHGVPERVRTATLRKAARMAGAVHLSDSQGWGHLPAYYGRRVMAG